MGLEPGSLLLNFRLARFEREATVPVRRHTSLDLAPGGTGFLLIERNQIGAPTSLRVVLNWFEELQRKLRGPSSSAPPA